jgi:hypothetical protein
MSSEPTLRSRLGRLERTDWAYLAGLVLLTLAGIVFAVWYVARDTPTPPPPPSSSALRHPSALGYVVSADDHQVVVRLGNGRKRHFAVRPADLPRVGVRYLAAHVGNRDSGFLIYYETLAGTDYVLGALETDPPLPGAG